MAFLAVFVALKIAHRAGGYAVWSWIPTKCDPRRSEYHLVQLKKSVARLSGKCRVEGAPGDLKEWPPGDLKRSGHINIPVWH